MTKRFLAPELSTQFMTAPTGKARVMRNLVPTAALDILIHCEDKSNVVMF